MIIRTTVITITKREPTVTTVETMTHRSQSDVVLSVVDCVVLDVELVVGVVLLVDVDVCEDEVDDEIPLLLVWNNQGYQLSVISRTIPSTSVFETM